MGIVWDDVEDIISEQALKLAHSFENYTFTGKDGGTEVKVDMKITDDESKEKYKEIFEGV